MSIEEHGDFFIERKTLRDSDGSQTILFNVGNIVHIGGVKKFKRSAETGYSTREEALKWVAEQQRLAKKALR